MNYQHKRHHEVLLQHRLGAIAQTYKGLAEGQRLHTVQMRDISREVLGRDEGTFEEVIEGIRALHARSRAQANQISGKNIVAVIVDEIFDDGRPKGKRNGKKK